MLEEYTNSEISALIDDYIHNESHRKILKRRLIDGTKYDALAAEFGLSRNQICNIVKKGKAVLEPL